LSWSLCFALDDFYKNLKRVFVSSLTGEGFKEINENINKLRQEYFEVYYKDLMNEIQNLKIKHEKLID